MVKALDEIFIGFVVFFIIERGIRLASALRYQRDLQETRTIGFEFSVLCATFVLAYIYRKKIHNIDI